MTTVSSKDRGKPLSTLLAERERIDPLVADRLGTSSAAMRAAAIVRGMRKRTGRTQKQLADSIGRHQEQISDIERGVGKHGPTMDMMFAIADACGMRLGPYEAQDGQRQPRNDAAAQQTRTGVEDSAAAVPGEAASRSYAPPEEGGNGVRRIVGHEIVLKGELDACEQVVVEGHVEGSLKDGGLVEISETGSFDGDLDAEEVVIGGRFGGRLNVRGRLTVRSTGRIDGEIGYDTIQVEPGGIVDGTLRASGASARRAAKKTPAGAASTAATGSYG